MIYNNRSYSSQSNRRQLPGVTRRRRLKTDRTPYLSKRRVEFGTALFGFKRNPQHSHPLPPQPTCPNPTLRSRS